MSARREGLESASFSAVMWGLFALCFLLLVMPTLVVVIVSFTSGFSLKFPPPGYSLRWYGELLEAWQLHFAATNSFKVALWTTVLSVVLGVAAALAIARSERWSARARPAARFRRDVRCPHSSRKSSTRTSRGSSSRTIGLRSR